MNGGKTFVLKEVEMNEKWMVKVGHPM